MRTSLVHNMINFVLRILIYLAVAVIGWSVGLVIPDPMDAKYHYKYTAYRKG